MGKVTPFSMKRNYLRLHLWLRKRCDQLTVRQRKVVVYGLSILYLICSLWMIAQFFLPQKEEENRIVIPKGELMDSPIKTAGQPHDCLYDHSTNSIT